MSRRAIVNHLIGYIGYMMSAFALAKTVVRERFSKPPLRLFTESWRRVSAFLHMLTPSGRVWSSLTAEPRSLTLHCSVTVSETLSYALQMVYSAGSPDTLR